MVDGPLKWHGGKHYLAPKIRELFPSHVHYVEPYFGGGSVLLAGTGEGVSEVANDIHFALSNFWQVLQDADLFEQFRQQMEVTPFSEVQFVDADEDNQIPKPFSVPGRLENAVAFFVRCRQSRQGLMKDFATLSRNRTRRGMNEQVSAWLTAIEGLPEVHARLKRVVILNQPALAVIRQQDGPNTLFYLDPPYLHDVRVTKSDYQHEMTADDHAALLDVLGSIAGRFVLSGYPSHLYDEAARANGWRHVDFDLPNNASSKSAKERKTERVWMNY